ncbi:MAG: carboxypeptidase regulatory-like domain-containing protein, partial [Bacteroidaceae bacterium]|nr:carboxypeptidase regulatory-like domain-containing protein [Bacteroidaceae bacterium]
MSRTSLLFLIVLLMFSASATAQKSRQRKTTATTQKADTLPSLQLRGCVLDALLQDSLPGVHVRLINNKGELAKLTQTAENGQYTLTDISPGKYTMKFTCMGFHDESRSLNITRQTGHLML